MGAQVFGLHNIYTEYDSEIVLEVGYVTMAWSHLERVVQYTVWELAEVEHELGEIITTRRGMSVWLQLIPQLAPKRQFTEAALKELETALLLVSEAQAARNPIAHGLWRYSLSKGYAERHDTKLKGRKRNKQLVFEGALHSSDDLKEIVAKIEAASAALFKWTHQYANAFPAPIEQKTLPPLVSPSRHFRHILGGANLPPKKRSTPKPPPPPSEE